MPTKSTLPYWCIVIILQILLIAWYQGLLDVRMIKPPTPPAPSDFYLTKAQVPLVRSAISIIQKDIEDGYLTDIDLTLKGFASLLPSDCREMVLKELGTPEMEAMRDMLEVLDGKVADFQ